MVHKKKIIVQLSELVLALAISLGAWAVGLVFRAGKPWDTVFIAVACLLGATIVINVVCGRLLFKKFDKMNMRELYDYTDGIRERAQADIAIMRKKAMRTIVLSYIYLSYVFALVCLCAFSLGMTGWGFDGMIVVILAIMYILFGVIDVLMYPVEWEDLPDLEMTPADFPLICQTAQSAAKAVGYDGEVKLYIVGNNVSVAERRGKAHISIGYREAALFTRDELYAVLLHELAHIVNADSRRAARLTRIEARWEAETNNASLLVRLGFFHCPTQLIIFNIELYQLFSNILKERAADDVVRDLDGGGRFADAIAKTEMIAKYAATPVPETDYYFYESEVQPANGASLDCKTFFKYYEKYGELWLDEVERELPPRIGSHPTARMRMESFGVKSGEYNANATEPDQMYVVEQQRVLEHADRYIAEMTKDSYAQTRDESYVQRKAAIDALNAAEAEGNKLTGAKRETALWALLGIDDDRAIALAEQMIADNDYAASAQFAKGYALRRMHDDRCIDCFKAAAAEPNFAEKAYDVIGEYALLTGNQALIEQYRADIPEVMQTAQDRLKDREFKPKSPTAPCDLDDQAISEFAGKVNAATDGAIKTLYITKYVDVDGNVYYPFAFEVTRKYAMHNANNADMSIFYQVYDVVSSYHGDPNYMMCNPKNSLIRKVKRSAGRAECDCASGAVVHID